MSSTTTTTNVTLEHPYRIGGIVAVLLSFGVLAYSLGVLARCGMGRGLCFDTTSHAAGDAGLVVFVVTFIVGVALYIYTGETASFQTRARPPETPKVAASPVTNVFPQAPAPAVAQPNVTNVFPAQPAPASAPSVTYVVAPSPSAIPANGGTILQT
jgi:hypothetical protein